MARDPKRPDDPSGGSDSATPEQRGGTGEQIEDDEPTIRVEDRRHWARDEEEETSDDQTGHEGARPTMIDEFRERAVSAEQKLQEYIEAFKSFRDEQEQFRSRMSRDVDRRVELSFGGMVAELLEALDDLDLALDHARRADEAEALVTGVELARRRFMATLERHGVEQLHPAGEPFDPNDAEAVRVDPVDSSERDGKVTEVLRPGYRLGERLIRAAQVAVGRFVGEPSA